MGIVGLVVAGKCALSGRVSCEAVNSESKKDKEKKEICIYDKEGKEVKTLPDGFGDDVASVIELLRGIMGLKSEPKATHPKKEEKPKETPKERHEKGESKAKQKSELKKKGK